MAPSTYQIEQWNARSYGWAFVWECEGSLEEAIEDLRQIEQICPDLSFRLVRVVDCFEGADCSGTKPTA